MQVVKFCASRDECANSEGPELALSEFYNDKSAKDGKQTRCKVCQLKYQRDNKEAVNTKNKKWKHANPDKVRASNKVYSANNKEKIAIKNNKWQRENPEKMAAKAKRYRDAHLEERREATRDWMKANPEKMKAHGAKRRAAKLQRTVAWADQEAIKQVYADCEEINLAAATAGCSERFSVDHIVPFQGEFVSGLHVENNLQIITEKENSRKKNHFDPATFND